MMMCWLHKPWNKNYFQWVQGHCFNLVETGEAQKEHKEAIICYFKTGEVNTKV